MIRPVRLTPFEYGWVQGSTLGYGAAALALPWFTPWWCTAFAAVAFFFAWFVLSHSYVTRPVRGERASTDADSYAGGRTADRHHCSGLIEPAAPTRSGRLSSRTPAGDVATHSTSPATQTQRQDGGA